MKQFFLFLLVCTGFHSNAQLASLEEKRHDTSFDSDLRKITLSDNQYFNSEFKNFLVLFTIVPDRSFNNKDSLLQDSKRIYDEILRTAGKRMEKENIDIAYWGKYTDIDNVIFSYSHGQYHGQVTYSYHPDTLLAPDKNVRQRLARLSYNKYVRHEIDRNGLSIVFTVILKDASIMNQKLAELDAVKFLVQYIEDKYNDYSQIKVFYVDQYSGEIYKFEAKVNDLILNNLANYLRAKKISNR